MGCSDRFIVRTGDRTGKSTNFDPDELEEEELEEEEDELISTSIGQATLRLGAELVISDRSEEEEDIKEVKRNFLVKKGGRMLGGSKGCVN